MLIITNVLRRLLKLVSWFPRSEAEPAEGRPVVLGPLFFLMRSPLFLELDGLLLFGLIFLALDGILVTLIAWGAAWALKKRCFGSSCCWQFSASCASLRLESGGPVVTRRGPFLWFVQAISAVQLILLAGLRDYAAVMAHLQNPLVFGLEVAFLVVVTAHALLGLRAILIDLGPGRNASRGLDFALLAIGLATIWYGIDLALDILW